MCVKPIVVVSAVLVLGLASGARAGTVLQFSFDGTLGNDVPSDLVDDTGTYTATIIAGTDPGSTVKYASSNPTYNISGASAEFNNSSWSDNAGDTFLIPDSGGIDFSVFDAFTAELFIYPSYSGSGQYRRMFSEYIYAYMYLDPGNTLHAVRKWSAAGKWNENWTHLQTASFPLDSWSHVAMTWDATATGAKFKLYVNGELVASDAGTSTATVDSTAGFTIGGYQREDNSTAQFFSGKIDEFRLSDAALDASNFLGATATVSFDSASSGALESVSPAELRVVLSGAEEGQPYAVDYAATGGTATGGGVDYSVTLRCECDFDNSGEVNFRDIAIFAENWLSAAPDSATDVTGDNRVDFKELAVCTLEWLDVCWGDTLRFEPGETTKTISVNIVNDGVDEEDETIVVTLSNPAGGDLALGGNARHTYTIFDCPPTVAFAPESTSGLEDSTPAVIRVDLSYASSEMVTVDYAVTGGTATGGGVDYTLADGTLQFSPGELSRHISIDIIDDANIEADETIQLTLSNPTNATLGSETEHIYVIQDDEPGTLFDGLIWYCSESANCMTVSEGTLVWAAPKGGQIVVRLPEQRFSQVGDIVTFSYIWSSSGDVDYSCECYKDYNPDPYIYDYCTDIRCVGGTGDFRIGLFDSDGKGYITTDNMGVNNEMFRGYLGYHFRVFPHVPQDAPARFTEHKTGGGSESHTNTSIWERNDPFVNSALLSNSNSWNRIDQPLTGGFGLPVGSSSLLTIRLQRVSATMARMSITCNGKTWAKYSETPSVIPGKIDVFAMYCNSGEYDYVKLSVPER